MFGTVTLTDEVVRAASEGSREQFARVAEAMLPQVRLMVLARLHPTKAQRPAVDDITQEVMLALNEGITRLRERTVGGLKAFVSGIAANKVPKSFKRIRAGENGRRVQSLDSTVVTLSGAGPLWQLLSISCTSPSSAAGRGELVARFFSELGRLKLEYREVITLALIDELPTRAIADKMGMSRNAAAMLLKRACNTLQRNMSCPSEVEQPDDGSA
jgi:RNA polymerase sigma factor (sigma-70 family)